jgi:uncharacterized protein YecE (DUF72 family)
MKAEGENKIGCCGCAVSQQSYFQSFRLIEIQHTFYQLPRLKTAEKWRDSAPQDFEFTMKAWQLITHEPSSPTYRRLKEKIDSKKMNRYGSFKPTAEVSAAWDRTRDFAKQLGARIVVFQCPASFRPVAQNIGHLRDFFKSVDRGDMLFVWEPRGPWPEDVVRELCEDLGLIHCVDPFKSLSLAGDFDYFRLHGITGYNYTYTDDDLDVLKSRIVNKPSYILFNNNRMYADALRFQQIAGRRS